MILLGVLTEQSNYSTEYHPIVDDGFLKTSVNFPHAAYSTPPETMRLQSVMAESHAVDWEMQEGGTGTSSEVPVTSPASVRKHPQPMGQILKISCKLSQLI